MKMHQLMFATTLGLSICSNSQAGALNCAQVHDEKITQSRKAKTVANQLSRKPLPSIEEAAKNIRSYRETVNGQILERGFVVDPFLAALIAKEHILLVGTPGNAKTTLAKILLSNIVDHQTRESFFYSMQMNKEITLSDTHGSINYKTMSDKGVIERNYNEGVLGAKLAFIDESFDIRPGAFRNLLDVLAERSHSQGTMQHKGLTELVIAATNKTLPEVYQEHNNTEGPRALIDRFAFTILVPKEMEEIKNDRAIFRGDRARVAPVHQISFADLDAVRSLMPKVTVPEYIADLASIIQYRLAPEFEAREVKAMEQYREKVQNGEHALPPFRASKYMSPRTLGKAGNILKAFIVLDYVEKNGQRSLTATTEDLSKLRAFYQMGGPGDKFLDKQLARALKEEEKEQLKALKTEREVTNAVFDGILKEFNESVAGFKLQEVDRMARDYKVLSVVERRQLMDLLKLLYRKGIQASAEQDKEIITPEMIASGATVELVQGYLHVLFSERANNILKIWQKELGYTSEKVLTPKQIRKQKYRYGFAEKESVGKLSTGKVGKAEFRFVQSRVLKGFTNSDINPLNFDFVGEKITFFKDKNTLTREVEDETILTKSTWGGGEKAIKAFPDGSFAAVLKNNRDTYFANPSLPSGEVSTNLHYRTHANSAQGIVQDAKQPDSYYAWDSNGLWTGNLTSLKELFKTENSDIRLTDFLQSESQFAAYRIAGDVSTIQIWHRENDQFIIKEADALKSVRSFSELNASLENSRLYQLSSEIGIVGIENGAAGPRFHLNLINFKTRTERILERVNSDTEIVNIALSSDRTILALTKSDSKVELYSVAKLIRQASTDGQVSLGNPEAILTETIASGEKGIGKFVASRFSDDGRKLLVAAPEGFVVFQVPQ